MSLRQASSSSSSERPVDMWRTRPAVPDDTARCCAGVSGSGLRVLVLVLVLMLMPVLMLVLMPVLVLLPLLSVFMALRTCDVVFLVKRGAGNNDDAAELVL
jgi:hypothetical protein